MAKMKTKQEDMTCTEWVGAAQICIEKDIIRGSETYWKRPGCGHLIGAPI